MNEKFVGIGEGARVFGLSRALLQRLVDSERIPRVKTAGGHPRLTCEAVTALNQKADPQTQVCPFEPSALGANLLGAVKSNTLTVLAVKDDAATGTLMASMFAKWFPGVIFLLATDRLDAVLVLKRDRPRILITDLRLAIGRRMSKQEIDRRGRPSPNVLFLAKLLNLQRLRGFVDAHTQIFTANARRALMQQKT